MYCSKCGTDNKDGCMFCSACGAPLKITVENAVPQKKKSKKPMIMIVSLLLIIVAAVIVYISIQPTEIYAPVSMNVYRDGNVVTQWSYKYNSNGTVKQKQSDFNSVDYSQKAIYYYSYDEDSKTITETVYVYEKYDGSYVESDSYKKVYYYNEKGQITEAVRYRRLDSNVLNDQIVFTYDDNGNLSKAVYYLLDDDGNDYGDRIELYSKTRTKVVKYNYAEYKNGWRLESTKMNWGSYYPYEHGSATYEYFDDENTIEMTVKYVGIAEDGMEETTEMVGKYEYELIENTSEIDMQSFITIIAFF